MNVTAEDLSIVIPTRQRWDKLRLTLSALERQTARGFETIVVVDGVDDVVPELPGVRVLQQEHAGPGVARNHGVNASDRPLVLFIGDDMIPGPEFVARHLARHGSEPADEVAVLGRIVWHPSVPRDRLHRWIDWSCAMFDYRQLEEEGAVDAQWARFYSSNVSLKREFFLAVGGFDPDFVYDYEDLDFGWRAGQLGMKLLYERDALVEHLHPYDWGTLERRYRSHAAGERLMAAKHDWFKPWFHGHIAAAAAEPRPSRLYPLLVDRIPRRPRRLRRAFERRANRYYLQRLAPAFEEAWNASRPLVTAPRD
ncbi:MAG TPA: glycosyltransferase [Thermoleophilaceae bacterium]